MKLSDATILEDVIKLETIYNQVRERGSDEEFQQNLVKHLSDCILDSYLFSDENAQNTFNRIKYGLNYLISSYDLSDEFEQMFWDYSNKVLWPFKEQEIIEQAIEQSKKNKTKSFIYTDSEDVNLYMVVLWSITDYPPHYSNNTLSFEKEGWVVTLVLPDKE